MRSPKDTIVRLITNATFVVRLRRLILVTKSSQYAIIQLDTEIDTDAKCDTHVRIHANTAIKTDVFINVQRKLIMMATIFVMRMSIIVENPALYQNPIYINVQAFVQSLLERNTMNTDVRLEDVQSDVALMGVKDSAKVMTIFMPFRIM